MNRREWQRKLQDTKLELLRAPQDIRVEAVMRMRPEMLYVLLAEAFHRIEQLEAKQKEEGR